MTNKELRKILADDREAETGMRQTTGAMIFKIVFGGLIVAAAFGKPDSGWTFHYFLSGLVLGGGFIAWGLIPYLKARRIRKEREMEQLAKILSTPLEKYNEPENIEKKLELLEKKYKDK